MHFISGGGVIREASRRRSSLSLFRELLACGTLQYLSPGRRNDSEENCPLSAWSTFPRSDMCISLSVGV